MLDRLHSDGHCVSSEVEVSAHVPGALTAIVSCVVVTPASKSNALNASPDRGSNAALAGANDAELKIFHKIFRKNISKHYQEQPLRGRHDQDCRRRAGLPDPGQLNQVDGWPPARWAGAIEAIGIE